MKKKFKLIEWAKEFAPKALGTTFDLVGDVTGIRAFNTLSDVIDKDNPDELSPEAIAKVAELRELDLKELELRLADTANARSREIELAKAGKKNDPMMIASGIVVLIAFMLMVVSVIFNGPLGLGIEGNPLFHQLMGIIEGVALSVFAYYYGTSKSSSDKTEMLRKN